MRAADWTARLAGLCCVPSMLRTLACVWWSDKPSIALMVEGPFSFSKENRYDASVPTPMRIRGFDAFSRESGPRFRGTCAKAIEPTRAGRCNRRELGDESPRLLRPSAHPKVSNVVRPIGSSSTLRRGDRSKLRDVGFAADQTRLFAVDCIRLVRI